MKKLKNVLMVVLVCMLIAIPVAMTGCFGGGKEAKLEIFRDFQYEYYYGEDLNVEDGMLKYTESGKKPEYVTMTDEAVKVDYFDNTLVGTNKLVITYKGETIEVEYKIKNYILVPNNQIYYYVENGSNYPVILYRDVANSVVYIQQLQGSIDEAVESFIQEKYDDCAYTYTSSMANGKEVLTIQINTTTATISANEDASEVYLEVYGGMKQTYTKYVWVYN